MRTSAFEEHMSSMRIPFTSAADEAAAKAASKAETRRDDRTDTLASYDDF
jgi:hypothetical protein